jgi:hypothetical protein
MLSETTLEYLSTLTYRSDAGRGVDLLPLGAIFWDDEMPEMRRRVGSPEDDQSIIDRLFAIRLKMWRGEDISERDQILWERVRSQVPDWAIFHRSKLSAEDQFERISVEQACAAEFESLLAEADQVTIGEDEHGQQRVWFTFDLTKEQTSKEKASWWTRISRKWKLHRN